MRGLQVGGELRRQNQGGAEDEFRRGDGAVLLGSGPQAEEDPRKVLRPRQTGETGLESILQLAVRALDHPVRLGMKGGGRRVGDAQLAADVTPESGSELRPAVGRRAAGDAEAGHPGSDEGVGTDG